MTDEDVLGQLELVPRATVLLTLSELESHLLGAANLLRGQVDQADFKSYIFPLLFFKRICDVYGEEYREALAESGGDTDYARYAEQHRFDIPDGCLWNQVARAKDDELGKNLSKALREIEKANPKTLTGIFGDTPWTNHERVPAAVLRGLLNHFSKRNLGNSAVEPDVLGQAYEYLIKKFADLSNKKAGEFYTPRAVVRLLVDILDPLPGETVYDPSCGTGGMLIEAVEHFKRRGDSPKALANKMFGQEKNLTTSGIARMNLILHGVEDFRVERGDTLRSPSFLDDTGRLRRFDCVIANPPFALEAWGSVAWKKDPHRRQITGVPPESTADFAWIQHMIASMAPGRGRAAVVLPQGVLFRSKSEGTIRQKIIESDVIEAVISLGENLFYGAGLAACVIVMRNKKPAESRGRVLLVDAADQFRKGRTQNTLEPGHISQIYDWYSAFTDIPGRTKLVTMAELEANDWSLKVPLYVFEDKGATFPPLNEAIASLEGALADAVTAEDALRDRLKEWKLLG
ncbi:N-6 DNA methylase [Streptomyces collinus]|uniref:type I restriction-modification system subunit M n=1 Tax=Streptomyces collinus TaxID=42684 RepID=UPI00369A1CA0